MVAIQRSRYVFVHPHDQAGVDLHALLRGEAALRHTLELRVYAGLTGVRRTFDAEQLQRLMALPQHAWTARDACALDDATLDAWLRDGFVLRDDDDDAAAVGLRAREAAFHSGGWNPLAVLAHMHARWRFSLLEQGRDGDGDPAAAGTLDDLTDDDVPTVDFAADAPHARANFQRFVAQHGPPPAAAHAPGAEADGQDLPIVLSDSRLHDLLARRRTVRTFDLARSLHLDDVAALCRAAFAARGAAQLTDDVTLLRKASPSGGGLHPIEIYVLPLRVTDLDPALYHYRCTQHRLVRVRDLTREAGQRLAVAALSGQAYAADAALLFLYTVRFPRHFWKYRNNLRGYTVVLQDLGHANQTLQLVALDRGLGAFYSAAIDAPRLEQVLGVDPAEEAALAIAGCGVPAAVDPLQLDAQPIDATPSG
ncbi:MAG: SagB family peptide dehydrogenase [Acidobacteriota bacterium]